MSLFLVTVDTEADDAWGQPQEIKMDNMRRIPKFQELCERYCVVPTYLVTYECASRDEAVSVLHPIKQRGACEIGHHLHVWTCPPYEQPTAAGVDNRWLSAFQSELPDSLFVEKSECLRQAIFDAYGDWPTSHRAGRWAIDDRGARWLSQNGFCVDSSVTPLVSWAAHTGKKGVGPSFTDARTEPYLWTVPGQGAEPTGSILEIPLTVRIPDNILARFSANLESAQTPGKKLLSRVLRRYRQPVMLRPTPDLDTRTLIGIVRQAIESRVVVVNLMLHSSELLLGASPRSRTSRSAERVWAQLEAIFKFVRGSGLQSATLSNAAATIYQSTILGSDTEGH